MKIITLTQVVTDIADALVIIDKSGVAFKEFLPGVGPYGEPQLVRKVIEILNDDPKYDHKIISKRCPDLLIPDQWAVEVKIVRPYGDNGKEAENWSVNLLHPYKGNVSSISDAAKLSGLNGIERKAIVVIGYEHTPLKIKLEYLVRSFEVIAKYGLTIDLSERVEVLKLGLIHPIHQQLHVYGWQVLDVSKWSD